MSTVQQLVYGTVPVITFFAGYLLHKTETLPMDFTFRPDPERAEFDEFLAKMKDDTQDNIVYVEPRAITAKVLHYPYNSDKAARIQEWIRTRTPIALEGHKRKD